MTENYVVFVEQPIKMDLFKIVTGKLRRKSISDGFLWDPKRNTIFHVIHKKSGEVSHPGWAGAKRRRCWPHSRCFFQVSSVKYLAKPLSTFHQINAYEDDGFLVLDMCASDDGLAIANYKIQNLRKSGEALDEVSTEDEPAAAAPRRADWGCSSCRCTTPCAGSSPGALSCLSAWTPTRPTTRT